MTEILRSNDLALLSYATALLAEQGIAAVVFDRHASVVDGSIAAVRRRVMVADDDAPNARRILLEAGIDGASV